MDAQVLFAFQTRSSSEFEKRVGVHLIGLVHGGFHRLGLNTQPYSLVTTEFEYVGM